MTCKLCKKQSENDSGHDKCIATLAERTRNNDCGKCGIAKIGNRYLSFCNKCGDGDLPYEGF